MLELNEKVDIFSLASDKTYIGILTNGVVNSLGNLVMGNGQAFKARCIYRELPAIFGKHVKLNGNIPLFISPENGEHGLFSFPTKSDYNYSASPKLITQSAIFLERYIKENKLSCNFYLPRPGCGLGGLKWEGVKSLIDFLPDNVIIVHN